MKALEPDSASAMKYTAQVSENTHTHTQRPYIAYAHTATQNEGLLNKILILF